MIEKTTIRTDQIRGKNPLIKHGTTEYWNNYSGFVPEDGEIIIYDDATETTNEAGEPIQQPKIKIGNGNAYVQDLAFLNQQENDDLYKHIQNNTIHVSNSDRLKWNNKLNVTDEQEVIQEILIFNRN